MNARTRALIGRSTLLGIIFVAADAVAAQAQLACTGGAWNVSQGAVITLPANTTSLMLMRANGQRAALGPAKDLSWMPSVTDIKSLSDALIESADKPRIVAIQTPPAECVAQYAVLPPTSGAIAAVSNAGKSSDTPNACQSEGAKWDLELSRGAGMRSRRHTTIVFMEAASGTDGSLCYYNRDYGVVGDAIYVGVFSNKTVAWTGARYEPCALQQAAPNILQSSDKFPGDLHAGTWELQKFLPRRCYNTSVDVSIVGSKLNLNAAEAVSQRFPLSQYDRYRGTIQAGVLFASNHDRTFALRSDQADTSRHFIYDKGPSNKGPDYVATLNLYGALKYLPAIVGGETYDGRDPIHDNRFFDRLGGIIGTAITNPSHRFVLGASFELIYGISIVYVIDWNRVDDLAPGLDATQPFKGAATTIPTVSAWHKHPTVGLSIDLRYVSKLFTGNR